MKNQNAFPFQYLLIGSGRVSRHFQKYFSELNLPFSVWSRKQSLDSLPGLISQASHILLLISDSAIENFYREHLQSAGKTVVHFSGALETSGVISAHPLMTFAQNPYDLKTYQQIPFILTSSTKLSEILPGLPNSHFQIPVEKKAFYHSLCVMSGNFTNLLWRKMSEEMSTLGLPQDVFHPYLQQITENIMSDSAGSLTGPISRRDLLTVIKNDQALSNDSYRKIYRAFLEVYFPESIKELS